MVTTPHFLFIHIPKTGGTFVVEALKRIYGREFRQPRSENWRTAVFHTLRFWKEPTARQWIKHAPCTQIPAQFSHLPIVSCIRNPLDWYVSNYKYAWWRSHPENYPGLRNDPTWPNLSFERYMALSMTQWVGLLNPDIEINVPVGRFTTLFINYFCNEPDWVLSAVDHQQLSERVKQKMHPISFLSTRTLNQDLHNYLSQYTYAPQQLAFILEMARISPRGNRETNEHWHKYLTPALLNTVKTQDRLIFEMFPTFHLPEDNKSSL